MKMAGDGRFLVLFPLLGVLLLGAGAQQKPLKLVGSEVIMEPKYTGNPSEINWKINGNKLVDMELNTQDEPTFYRLGDRATIDRTNGVLTIRDLTTGDSGDYRAEALVNNVYQYTDIKLTVRACPDEPKITNQTTEENIVLTCESSTLGVTYEWFNQTGSVGKEQSYSEPRPKNYDVNLTCVVDNEVCKKSSSILIHYIPDNPDVSIWKIIVIIFVVLLLVLLLVLFVIALLHHHREQPHVKGIYSALTRSETPRLVTAFEKVHFGFTCCKVSCMVFVFDKVCCCLTCCKGRKTGNDEEKQKGTNKTENEQNIPLIAEGTNKTENEQNIPLIAEGVKEDEGDVEVEEGNGLDKTVEDSDSCGSISLNLSSKGPVQRVKLMKIGEPSIEVEVGELNGHLQRMKSLVLTVERVKTEDYTAVAFLPNREPNEEPNEKPNEKSRVFPIKGVKGDEKDGEDSDVEKGNGSANSLDGKVEGVKGYIDDDVEKGNAAADALDGKVEADDVVIIRTWGDRVILTVPDTEEVTKLSWKKGDATQFEWTISGVELHTNKITLEPGSVTIKNLVPGDSGSYEVAVHSTDNNITKNTFQLEVVKQVETENRRNIRLIVVRTVDPPENGHTESQPIGSITFHPVKIINKTEITWKKGGQPVNFGDRIEPGQNGDLTIKNVKAEDKGIYTVHCGDQEQEFDLRL